jgi:hypothetical protein
MQTNGQTDITRPRGTCRSCYADAAKNGLRHAGRSFCLGTILTVTYCGTFQNTSSVTDFEIDYEHNV